MPPSCDHLLRPFRPRFRLPHPARTEVAAQRTSGSPGPCRCRAEAAAVAPASSSGDEGSHRAPPPGGARDSADGGFAQGAHPRPGPSHGIGVPASSSQRRRPGEALERSLGRAWCTYPVPASDPARRRAQCGVVAHAHRVDVRAFLGVRKVSCREGSFALEHSRSLAPDSRPDRKNSVAQRGRSGPVALDSPANPPRPRRAQLSFAGGGFL